MTKPDSVRALLTSMGLLVAGSAVAACTPQNIGNPVPDVVTADGADGSPRADGAAADADDVTTPADVATVDAAGGD